jgi:hypothetical protein
MKTAYDLACALEDGLDSVEKLARALMMMADNLGEKSEPIIEVARHIRNRARLLETRRAELCQLLQPSQPISGCRLVPLHSDFDRLRALSK